MKYENLEYIEEYRIGVVNGFSYSDEFDNSDYLNKDIAQTPMLNLKKFLYNRVDLIIGAEKVYLFKIFKNYPEKRDDIEVLEPPVRIQTLHLAIPKDSKKINLLKDFNRGLKQIREDGTVEKIIEKYEY